MFKSLDPETGRPDVDPAHKPGTGKTADFCPSLHGGKNWPPIAFSPKTRMIYIPANNNLCGTSIGRRNVDVHRRAAATPARRIGRSCRSVPGADHFGEVQAWNVDTGKKVWTHNYAKSPNWGAMLATGGGLVFSGGTNDRKFHAFDATTGKLLWEFPTSSGHSRAADVVHRRRQAVHRRALRLGRRFARDAGDAQQRVPGRVSGSAGRRQRLGVRDRVTYLQPYSCFVELIEQPGRRPCRIRYFATGVEDSSLRAALSEPPSHGVPRLIQRSRH